MWQWWWSRGGSPGTVCSLGHTTPIKGRSEQERDDGKWRSINLAASALIDKHVSAAPTQLSGQLQFMPGACFSAIWLVIDLHLMLK